MKKRISITAAVGAAGMLAFALAVSAPASAEVVVADANPCKVEGWFVNPDEAGREPTRTYDGFVFENTDLIHHNAPAGLTTKDLTNGGFAATPNPDQSSFFSVEVSGDDGGYATLRWDRVSIKWVTVVGGVLYENTDPDKLVDMPPVKRSHKVVRFGVGYTVNPPGTVKTTVSSVSFLGTAYTFKCAKPSPTGTPTAKPTWTHHPKPTGTPTHGNGNPCWYKKCSTPKPTVTPTPTGTGTPKPTVTPTVKPTPTPTKTKTQEPTVVVPASNDEPTLPVTGAGLTGMLLASGAALVLGVGAILFTRKRRSTRH